MTSIINPIFLLFYQLKISNKSLSKVVTLSLFVVILLSNTAIKFIITKASIGGLWVSEIRVEPFPSEIAPFGEVEIVFSGHSDWVGILFLLVL